MAVYGKNQKGRKKDGQESKSDYFRRASGFRHYEKKDGAQRGDYVIISDGKRRIQTRVSTDDHPFYKKKPGDTATIKGIRYTLVRLIRQGTEEYHKVYDHDSEREHYGF
jgi:hypothetical protein